MAREALKSFAVAWDDLLMAFEFANSGSPGELEAFLCMKTGVFHYVSSYVDAPEEVPEDVGTSDQYIAIPQKNDLDLGRRLVFDFVRRELPDDWDDVSDMFHRRGAYGRYRQLLNARGALEKWRAFEARATEKALREWAAGLGIAFQAR